jgi:hypothetical protein
MAITKDQAVSGGAGAVVGATGVFGMFKLVNLNDILKTTGTPISMLDALAIFSVLALFSIFAYSQAVQGDADSAKLRKIVTIVFSCLLGLIAVAFVWLVIMPGAGVKLTTNFDNFKDVAGFQFATDAEGQNVETLNPDLQDGASHTFDKEGNNVMDLTPPTHGITVEVAGLKELKAAYNSLSHRYSNMVDQHQKLAHSCREQIGDPKITTFCATLLNAAPNAETGG